jgi:hypothetical protein
VINSLDVSGCQILCYESPLTPAIAFFEPISVIFFVTKNEFSRIQSMVSGRFSPHLTFQQHPAFRASYNRDEFCMLNESSQPLSGFLFPDMKEVDAEIAERIRSGAELPPCKNRGAILLPGMPVGLCCKPFDQKIIGDFSPPMEEELRQRLYKFVASNRNLPWKLNPNMVAQSCEQRLENIMVRGRFSRHFNFAC